MAIALQSELTELVREDEVHRRVFTDPEGFGPGFDLADYPLTRPARVESYRGFLFASLSPEGPSLAEHLATGKQYLDLMCDRAPEGRIQATKPLLYRYNGNWKLQMDNYA